MHTGIIRRVQIARSSLLIGLLAALLSACGDDDATPTPPRTSPTPAPVAWQRPQAPIAAETFAQVHLTGLFRQPQGTVNDVAFSANGLRMASVAADQSVTVWNLASGEPLYAALDLPARYVFFGPDDETLITVDNKGDARVWGMPEMSPPRQLEPLTRFSGHDEPAGLVAQSADRALLAFGTAGGLIRVWEVPAGEMRLDLPGHSGLVQSLGFSPDGALLASASTDGGVRVWSTKDGELLYDLPNENDTPLRAVFAPDSESLAVARAGSLDVWGLAEGEQRYTVEMPQYAAAGALAWSPDGALIAGCGQGRVVGVWRADDGAYLGGLPLAAGACADLAFSPDSRLLGTLPAQGQDFLLWNVTRISEDVPAEQKVLDQRNRDNLGLPPGIRFYDMAWSPDGRFIVLLDQVGPIYVLSAAE